MRIRVIHNIGDLTSDLRSMNTQARSGFARATSRNAKAGSLLAKEFARESAGSHGKHYPNAISAERINLFAWEYGPDASMPQGDMSFEWGSRNQPPHLDLNRSADIVGPRYANDIIGVVDEVFW
jgi:hypothetical protein